MRWVLSEDGFEPVKARKMTPDESNVWFKKAAVSERLEHLSTKYVQSKQSFFKPRDLQEDFEVIYNGPTSDSTPIFFQQMADAEIHQTSSRRLRISGARIICWPPQTWKGKCKFKIHEYEFVVYWLLLC